MAGATANKNFNNWKKNDKLLTTAVILDESDKYIYTKIIHTNYTEKTNIIITITMKQPRHMRRKISSIRRTANCIIINTNSHKTSL